MMSTTAPARCWLSLLLLLVLAIRISPASAQVIWEDYQGTVRVFGTSNQDKAGPSYNNDSGALNIASLRAISATVTNATRTGTSSNIDFPNTAGALCNTDNMTGGYDPDGTGETCMADAQGRVLYALVRFPAIGSYSFSAAHDDEIDLDISSDFINTNYRQASYDVPAGSSASYTAVTTFEALAGTYTAFTPNACALIRLYWNNAGGLNHLRLRWTKPGNITEIIPASQFFDPAAIGSRLGCLSSIVTSATSLSVNKAVGSTGRASTADQFTVAIKDSAETVTLAASTTSGSGTGQQASTGATIIAANTTYKITDEMAAGSNSTMGAYTATIACTRAGLPYVPSGAAPTWTVVATAANQQIICTITNSRRSATLQLRKTWSNARITDTVIIPSTSGFSTNTLPLISVALLANTIDTGIAVNVLVGDTGTLPAEIFTIGSASQYGATVTCSGGALTGGNGATASSLSITEAAAGTAILCTYANIFRQPMTVSKNSVPYSDPVNGTTSPKYIPGALVTYQIAIANPSSLAVTQDSIVLVDALPPGAHLFTGDLGSPGSGPLSFVDGASLSGLTYNFSGLSSAIDDVDFSNNGGTSWGYTPSPDANGIDAGVTHVRIRLKGSMAPSSTFQIWIRCKID